MTMWQLIKDSLPAPTCCLSAGSLPSAPLFFYLAALRMPSALATGVSCCNFSAFSEKSSAAADRASASVCSASAFLFALSVLTSSLRAFLFWPATTFDLIFFWSSKYAEYLCRALAQYSSSCLLLTLMFLMLPTDYVVTNRSLSCKCWSCHVFNFYLFIDRETALHCGLSMWQKQQLHNDCPQLLAWLILWHSVT